MPRSRKRGNSASTKKEEQKPTTSAKDKKLVFVKNRTNQKQVIQVDEKLMSLNPYEKIELELNKEDAEKKFAYWISKNIVQIVNN